MPRTVIFCAACAVRVVPPRRAMPEHEVTCPCCKATDSLTRVLSDARSHATHLAKREYDRRMAEAGRELTYRTPTRIPLRSLRWITGTLP